MRYHDCNLKFVKFVTVPSIDDFDSISDDIEMHLAAKKELEGSPDTKAANRLIEKVEKIVIDYDEI